MGRRFVGIEVEKDFLEIGLQRLQDCQPASADYVIQGGQQPSRFDDEPTAIAARRLLDEGAN